MQDVTSVTGKGTWQKCAGQSRSHASNSTESCNSNLERSSFESCLSLHTIGMAHRSGWCSFTILESLTELSLEAGCLEAGCLLWGI